MKYSEFVRKVARNSEMTKKDTLKFLNGFLESMTEVLAAGDEITFKGFGKFGTKELKGKTIKHPLTKENVEIPVRKKVRFTEGKYLKEAVNS